MAVKTIQIRKCDLCYSRIGLYYSYDFSIPESDTVRTATFDTCPSCGNKIEEVIRFLGLVVGYDIKYEMQMGVNDENESPC